MLNALREGAKSGVSKFILFGFMVLATGGLVFMDIGGFFRGGVSSGAVAKIAGNELSLPAFDRTLRRVLASQGLDPQTAFRLGMVEQVLRSEISNNLLQKSAADLGLRVSDVAVARQINRLVEPMVTGEVTRKAALENILRSQGMTERDFVATIKSEMTNILLRNAIIYGSSAESGALAADMYRYENETRTIRALILTHDTAGDPGDAPDEVLLPFYQAGQERYAIPETRRFSVAVLERESYEKSLDIAEEELRALYERDIATYQKAEHRLLEQAVFDDMAKADKAAEYLKSGKSLKDSTTEAAGDDSPYLGEETFEQSGLLKEIAETAFAAEKDAIVGPVETPLGWHLIRVKDIIAPQTEPFEKVRDSLRREILQLRIQDEMFTAANNIDDRIAGGASFEETVEAMDLKVKTYGPIKRDGSTADNKDGLAAFGPAWPQVVETAFDLATEEISPAFELADGQYAILRLDEIAEKSYRPFEDVKAELARQWKQDQREVANRLRAQDAIKSLHAGEKNIKEIAAQFGVAVKTYKVTRNVAAPAPLDDRVKPLFFSLPPGQSGFGPVKDGYVIAEIVEAFLPEPPAKAGEDDDKTEHGAKILQVEQNEIGQMFFGKLNDDYRVKVNARLLEQTYGAGGEQF